MKSLLIILVILNISFNISTLLYNTYIDYTFEHFISEYKKTYKSNEHYEEAKIQFYKNLDMIKLHNSNEKKTYTMAVNKFADLSNEQMSLFKGLKKNQYFADKLKSNKLKAPSHSIQNLPTSIDWRTKGAVSPVKNQEQCGSCCILLFFLL